MDANELIDLITKERKRQRSLPGSEFDLTNGPNDWSSIAAKYLTESAQCHGIPPLAEEYRDSLIKAAAVILAALDHLDTMKDSGKLR